MRQTTPYPEQAILRDLLRHYHVLLKPQVRRYLRTYLTDDKINKLLSYMAKRQMLYLDAHHIALNKQALRDYDEKRIQAFWVLLTIPSLIYHHPSDHPISIHFLTEKGEGQIIYVTLGEERLVNALLKEDNDITWRVVIVEDPEQILALDIAHTDYYCTIDAQGQLAKYVKT